MQNKKQAMMDALKPSLTLSPSEPYVCSFCSRVVPKFLEKNLGLTVQPCCECESSENDLSVQELEQLRHKREIEERFSISNLGERFMGSTFDKFVTRPGTENALDYAKSFANTFPAYGGNALMIWGPCGNGKSHLAAAVVNSLQEKGHKVVFQTMSELLERIRATFNSNNKESEKDIMLALQTCDLLVLDDIGAEKVSDWVQDVLFRIVDGRYRRKMPIFYTTNLQPVELKDKIGPRIFDRIIDTSILVQITATSYRMELAQERARQMKNR